MIFEKLDALERLLGCYLHQDWLDEFDDDVAAVRAILESEPRYKMAAGVREIDALLNAELPEDVLRTILVDQIGCYFDPSSEGLSYEEWLNRVRGAFSAELSQP